MTSNSQPKEIQDKINRIKKEMLDKTNMTENEAYDFAFKCWQCGLDFTKGLEKENQDLKDKLNDSERNNEWLREHYGIYKKVIDILKGKFIFEMIAYENSYYIVLYNKTDNAYLDRISLTQQEYELLKEVLANEEKD